MAGNHPSRGSLLRRFTVVEDSMRPALQPGDGLLALRLGPPRRGQVRVFPDPTVPTRWLVKRVGGVRGAGDDAAFEACSDNPRAPGVVDSRRFGWVPAAGSYRVVWTVSGQPGASHPFMSVALLAVVSSCVLTGAYRILSRSTHSRVGRQQGAPIGADCGQRIPRSHRSRSFPLGWIPQGLRRLGPLA